MSTNTTNGNHTLINSILSASLASKQDSRASVITLADYTNYSIPVNNKLYIEHWEGGCYVQIWRVAQ
jgi:hypothetical protein